MDGSRLFIAPTILLILSVLRRKPKRVSSYPKRQVLFTVN